MSLKKAVLMVASLSLFAKEMVVYPDGAFIRETRKIENGKVTLPKCVKGDSILLEKERFRFIPSGNINHILNFYLGKEVEFYYNNQLKKGKLLSLNPLILQGDRVYLNLKPSDILVKQVPPSFTIYPSLAMDEKSGSVEVGYECKGISWRSLYNLSLDKKLKLQGFIHLKTPQEFKDVKLSFLAKRQPKPKEFPIFKARTTSLTPQAVEGSYLYTLPKKVDVKNNLFISYVDEEIPYKKRYIARWENLRYAVGEEEKHFLQLITFISPKTLPAGEARFFKGGILIETSRFPALSQGEKAKLQAGEDFDLKVTRKVLKREEDKKRWKSEVIYLFENPKREKVKLEVIEMIPTTKLKVKGDCETKVLDASHLLIQAQLNGDSKICHFSFSLKK